MSRQEGQLGRPRTRGGKGKQTRDEIRETAPRPAPHQHFPWVPRGWIQVYFWPLPTPFPSQAHPRKAGSAPWSASWPAWPGPRGIPPPHGATRPSRTPGNVPLPPPHPRPSSFPYLLPAEREQGHLTSSELGRGSRDTEKQGHPRSPGDTEGQGLGRLGLGLEKGSHDGPQR